MRVVSNTSPLCNLAIIGRLDLLKRRYGTVVIPEEVAQELRALSHAAAKAAIDAAIADGWLKTETLAPGASNPFDLDAGEAAAITLAQSTGADVLLIDERKGRAEARNLGLPIGGLLGELLYAKQTGALPDLRIELSRLRTEAGFFIDSEIEKFILDQAGE